MTWEFEPVAGPFAFTEGPVWTGDAVLFSDIPTDRILRFDPSSGETTTWAADTDAGNGLALGPDGAVYCCADDRVTRYAPDGTRTTVVESYGGAPFNGPNDLAFDREGRLWFSDPDYEDDRDVAPQDARAVYRVSDPASADARAERVVADTTNPNGLAFAPDGDVLYVAQSEFGEGNPRELRAYALDGDGEPGDYAVLHEFPHRGVDRMCLDDAGDVVAAAGRDDGGPGPTLYVFAPDGRLRETHDFPGRAATNCCFGGPALDDLYVTGYDGYLRRVRTDRTGHRLPPETRSQ